jgi:hypothetical protein
MYRPSKCRCAAMRPWPVLPWLWKGCSQEALGAMPVEVCVNAFNYLARLDSVAGLRALVPDMSAIARLNTSSPARYVPRRPYRSMKSLPAPTVAIGHRIQSGLYVVDFDGRRLISRTNTTILSLLDRRHDASVHLVGKRRAGY